jgi:hypothetical protein
MELEEGSTRPKAAVVALGPKALLIRSANKGIGEGKKAVWMDC